jgi:TP901 family phage tail tape measure protein
MAFGSLAELYVEVKPDTSKFGPRLVRDLERKYRRGISIPVRPDTRRFAAEVSRTATHAGKAAGRSYNTAFNKTASKYSSGINRGLSGVAGIAGRIFTTAAKAAAIGVVAATAAVGVGLAKATNKAGAFDKTMRLAGTTMKATSGQMKGLTDLAIEMGAKTSFSAQGAADAMMALAKGGMKPAQIQAGALKQTLTLASAGGLELGNAADYMVRGLGAFHLKAKQASRVASALAGAANASTGTVENMGLALQQVAATAASSGQSIEETTAALAAFDNAGIRGSDAGTSLKTMLARLVPMTEKAKGKFKELGLITEDGANQFFKANGEMKSITQIAGILDKALGGLSTQQRISAMNTLFGSDATRAATILMNEGSDGLAKYVKATSDRAAAEKLAKTATEGYAGALERIKGSIETVQIIGGKEFLPGITDALNGVSKWLEKNQGAIKTVFSVAAGALEAFGETAEVVLGGFLSDLSGGKDFKSFADNLAQNQVEIATWGVNAIDTFIAVGQGVVGWVTPFLDSLASANIGAALFMETTIGLMENLKVIAEYTGNFIGANMLGNAIEQSKGQAKAFRDSAASTNELATSLKTGLTPALEKARNRAAAMRDTAIAKAETREATYALSRAIDKVGKSGDVAKNKLLNYNIASGEGTKAQRAFGSRVLAVRGRMIDQALAGIKAGDSQKELTKRWQDGKDALYREFRQMGFSKKRAQELTDKYGKIPGKSETKITQPGMSKARQDTKDLDNKINGLNNRTVKIMVALGKQGFSRQGLQETVDRRVRHGGRLAGGGRLDGPGTGTSDSILGVEAGTHEAIARVSKGEWVVNAKSSEKYDELLSDINADALAGGGKIRQNVKVNTSHPARAMGAIPGQVDSVADAMATRTWKAYQKVIEKMGGGIGHGSKKHVRWHGGTFTERYANTLKAAQKADGKYLPVIQGGFRPRTSFSGSSHAGDAIDTQWNSSRLSAMNRKGSYAWHRTPSQGPWGHHIHAIPKKGMGYPGGSGIWQQGDAARGGNGLATGGTVNQAGWAKVGERGEEMIRANKGDKVTPLNQPISIQLNLGDDLRYIIQGQIDDNNEFHAGIGRLSR